LRDGREEPLASSGTVVLGCVGRFVFSVRASVFCEPAQRHHPSVEILLCSPSERYCVAPGFRVRCVRSKDGGWACEHSHPRVAVRKAYGPPSTHGRQPGCRTAAGCPTERRGTSAPPLEWGGCGWQHKTTTGDARPRSSERSSTREQRRGVAVAAQTGPHTGSRYNRRTT
jgi:hypothetical protein